MAVRDTTLAEELRLLLGPLNRALARRAQEAGVTGLTLGNPQSEVLRTLTEYGPLSVTDLATKLAMARSTVSNLIKPMAKEGLLTREPSPRDSRSVLVGISEAVRAMVEATGRARVAAMQDAIDSLTPAERDTLGDALPVLRTLLERVQGGVGR